MYSFSESLELKNARGDVLKLEINYRAMDNENPNYIYEGSSYFPFFLLIVELEISETTLPVTWLGLSLREILLYGNGPNPYKIDSADVPSGSLVKPIYFTYPNLLANIGEYDKTAVELGRVGRWNKRGTRVIDIFSVVSSFRPKDFVKKLGFSLP